MKNDVERFGAPRGRKEGDKKEVNKDRGKCEVYVVHLAIPGMNVT